MDPAIRSRQREIGRDIAGLQLDRRISVRRHHVECSDRRGRRGDRDTPQLREQIQTPPPLEYAILMKGLEHMWAARRTFFHAVGNSPIRRIGAAAVALVIATACNKLGLGDSSPTGPTP